MWHNITKRARESGELVLLGVIQEQHSERCQLFAQWQNFDWPILHDPINLLNARAVPMFIAIDEAGVVIDANLTTKEFPDFLKRPVVSDTGDTTVRSPSASELDRSAMQSNDSADWIAAGDQRILWGGTNDISRAIKRYSTALKVEPRDAATYFRLGVAYRMRYDTNDAKPDDFQSAVNAWGDALEIDPNHYIFRRRIQQYGPRLTKPYPFYDWIGKARSAIVALGETPIQLTVEPVGAEIASPAKTVDISETEVKNPDVDGRITLDQNQFINAQTIVVPGSIQRGDAVRVHVKLTPKQSAHWNNEAEPLKIWIDVPDGWKAESPLLTSVHPDKPESKETRSLDFELQTSAIAKVQNIRAYALYYICEDSGGQCLYRRQDITIPIQFRE